MFAVVKHFRRDEGGASMVEYGLLVALIAVVIAGSAQIIGTQLSTMFSNLGAFISTVVVPATI